MNNKICLVTGASSGLGQAIATGLARQGATVVLACRNLARATATRERIQALTGNPNIEILELDLASLQSVQACAAAYHERYTRLNVLVHNAAALVGRRIVTPDGLELMFATNHLGPFLLTQLLLDVLKNGALARILTITGPASTRLHLDDLQSEILFHTVEAFAASRLCSQLCTFELARRLDGRGVTANLINPGLVRTNLLREAPALIRWLWRAGAASPERAAQPVVRLALSPDVVGLTGRMFKRQREVTPPAFVRDPQLQAQVWQKSLELAGIA